MCDGNSTHPEAGPPPLEKQEADKPIDHESSSTDMNKKFSLENSEVISANVLRATTAGVALAGMGGTLRVSGSLLGDLASGKAKDEHEKSFVVTLIDQFWSHSWRASVWQKIATLLLYYNSLAAAAVSIISAVLGTIMLWPNRLIDEHEYGYPSHASALIFGFLGFIATLLVWKSSSTVFLDKICICQTNDKLKEDGIVSIGGFVRHSAQMLILWDKTYLERLWCVFELATVMRLRVRHDPNVIRTRPVRSGATVLLLFVGCCSNRIFMTLACSCLGLGLNFSFLMTIIGYGIHLCISFSVVQYIRGWHEEVCHIHLQIEQFSFHNARCFCCDCGHVLPGTDVTIPCDRLVVKDCIDLWFGDIRSFDAFVRDQLSENFKTETRLLWEDSLLVALPYVWSLIAMFAELLAPDVLTSSNFERCINRIYMYAFTLCLVPVYLNLSVRSMALFASWSRRGLTGWTVNTFIVILWAGFAYSMESFVAWASVITQHYIRAVIFIFILLLTVGLFPDVRGSLRDALMSRFSQAKQAELERKTKTPNTNIGLDISVGIETEETPPPDIDGEHGNMSFREYEL